MFEIVAGRGLDDPPKLVMGNLSVCVGSQPDPEAHEKHFLRTVGSGNRYFSEDDEFRFDPVTGMLSSLRLHIPERNATSHVPPDLPAEPGSIRLTDLRPFGMEPTALRSFADGRLTCLYTVDTPDRRVRVASDFDLFFSAGELSGWSLALADSGFTGLLADYFALVTDSTIARLEREDPAVMRDLQALAERVGTSDDARADLHDRISYMIDLFSG